MKSPYLRLFVDQYGSHVYAATVKQLRERAGGGRVSLMFNDLGGKTYREGYVIGRRWFTEYRAAAVPA